MDWFQNKPPTQNLSSAEPWISQKQQRVAVSLNSPWCQSEQGWMPVWKSDYSIIRQGSGPLYTVVACSLSNHISPRPPTIPPLSTIVFTIELRMVTTFQAHSPISLWHVSFWCPFLTTNLGKISLRLKYRYLIKKSDHIRTTYLSHRVCVCSNEGKKQALKIPQRRHYTRSAWMIPTAAAPKYNENATCKNQEQKKWEVIIQQVPLALVEKKYDILYTSYLCNFLNLHV